MAINLILTSWFNSILNTLAPMGRFLSHGISDLDLCFWMPLMVQDQPSMFVYWETLVFNFCRHYIVGKSKRNQRGEKK